LIYKKVGFSPFQVLKEIKPYINEEDRSKLTFVGRLDPMAEGNIHILWSGDAQEKNNITLQDKEYKIEVLLGIKTDTDDILGLIDSVDVEAVDFDIKVLENFIGPFHYDYPKYSSPHIKKVLKGEDVESKKQDGEIYGIDFLGLENVSNANLNHKIFTKLNLCQMEGDFRLDEIKLGWESFFQKNKGGFQVLSLNVKCKRGTYMRVLSRELGGLALSIIRE
jgi:tRNA pseudouridine(55) synthase